MNHEVLYMYSRTASCIVNNISKNIKEEKYFTFNLKSLFWTICKLRLEPFHSAATTLYSYIIHAIKDKTINYMFLYPIHPTFYLVVLFSCLYHASICTRLFAALQVGNRVQSRNNNIHPILPPSQIGQFAAAAANFRAYGTWPLRFILRRAQIPCNAL